MKSNGARSIHRRTFLKLASAAGVGTLSPGALAAGGPRVCLIIDPENPAASSGPAKRAADHLARTLKEKNIPLDVARGMKPTEGASFCIALANSKSPLATGFPHGEPTNAESLRIAPGRADGVPGLLISAKDARGFVYALLEVAERVQFGDHPLRSLQLPGVLEEEPANEVRGVSRYFCSELEDKPWYYDKDFWSGYLDRLIASRFNRFTMAFGLEYDFPRGVTDDYFHFVYPYLVEVPEHSHVRAVQLAATDGTRLANPAPLSADERARNLDMLRFIAAETAARGLEFHLGIWTHAHQWTDSPNAYHRIEGLTPDNHARYCRDALAMILRLCPEIEGLTMRVHGESGIPEGSYDFWQTVFEAIANAGRTIEIDMHAKGVDERMIDIAAATGMPVKLGAKYSAEHQGLGYQQADIRALEVPHGSLSKTDEALFRFSSGSRSFTRYGYADFLRQGTRYKLWFRLWPGTQRHLLSVDPEMAAAYGRTASFCGASGLDLMEPLTFKGREGSGQPGGRCAYADTSLNPRYDWEKFDLYYRVWGRRLYNPDADQETWRRTMRPEFGPATEATENALAQASRILPLLTSAHLPSASNHDLWYELPTNMPIVEGSEPSPYGDTPIPKIFGTVSPLDPQMFSAVAEYVQSLVHHAPSAKYSPMNVAGWLEKCVSNATHWLNAATGTAKARGNIAFRRIEEDVLIQVGLGTFFAHKLRSAVQYELFQQTGDTSAGNAAIDHYQDARNAWASMAQRAKDVYRPNVSYGSIPKRSGHWLDRLPEIDTDLAAMKMKIQMNQAPASSRRAAAADMNAMAGSPQPMMCKHTPAQEFLPGKALALKLAIQGEEGIHAVRSVRLWYRHVNQAERWRVTDASGATGAYEAAIPKEYTQSEFALEYYFELADDRETARMYPGFNKTLSSQPYFAVCKRADPGPS
ncbi:MAG TPA: hypothetical protein VKB38_24080 [Terracidiphilus sp.]|nr:hypothetical protein [Terracidiphilus sp.]